MTICLGCQKEKPIKSKKLTLCQACYVHQKRHGSFERSRQPRGMCTVEGCDKQAHGRGLCHMHLKRVKVSGSLADPRADNINLRTNQKLYNQWDAYQRPDSYPIVPEWKADFFVFTAGVGEKPSPKHRLYRIDKSQPLGPGNFEWRERMVTRSKDETDGEYNERHRQARKVATGSAMWDNDLRRRYGQNFGLKDLRAMAEAQNHLCAVCGKPETGMRNGMVRHLAVDHDHATGAVRALLCQSCNQGLGFFKDDVNLLAAAIAYLHKHKTPVDA